MPGTIIAGAMTSPPAVVMTTTLLDQWTAWKAALLGGELYLKLFSNDFTVAPQTSLADLVEAAAPGYAPITVSSLNGPYLDQSGNAYMTSPEALWTCSGGGDELEYGAFLAQSTGSAATATATGAGGVYETTDVTAGGSGYLTVPRVTATGATGTGATFTAVLTAGVVTSITITNPGTGYTTYLLTIEPPLKLVVAANFSPARPLQQSTDAIPFVMELDNLAA